MMLVNVTLDINGHKQIIVQDSRLYWSCSFLMAQLKRSWQYWHSCIVQNLRKTLLRVTKSLLFSKLKLYETLSLKLPWHSYCFQWRIQDFPDGAG